MSGFNFNFSLISIYSMPYKIAFMMRKQTNK